MPLFACSSCPAVYERATRARVFCPDCRRRRHAERQRGAMRAKRAADPVYCLLEREAVKKRMRKIRSELHTEGLNNRGLPYKSPKWSRRMMAKATAAVTT